LNPTLFSKKGSGREEDCSWGMKNYFQKKYDRIRQEYLEKLKFLIKWHKNDDFVRVYISRGIAI